MARPAVYVKCDFCCHLFKRKYVSQKLCSSRCAVKIKKGKTLKTSRKRFSTTCCLCSKVFHPRPAFIRRLLHPFYFCSVKCRGKALKRGMLPYGFKNQKRKQSSNRYLRKVINGKYQYIHRWLMEKKTGRKLCTNEHVHHINNNPKDNRIENLEIISRSNHAKLHFSTHDHSH